MQLVSATVKCTSINTGCTIAILHQNQSETYLMVEDTKEIANETANFVCLAILLLVDFLQMSHHVHDLDKSLLKNFLLFLEGFD